jgi:chaperonin GroES
MEYNTVQRRSMPSPSAHINSGSGNDTDRSTEDGDHIEAMVLLDQFIAKRGDISDLLDPGVVDDMGIDAVREWESDRGSIADWLKMAERGMSIAAQDSDETPTEWPWADSSNIHYPVLTSAALQWAARAYAELVKGDKTVEVRVFQPPAKLPSAGEVAKAAPQPQTPQAQQAASQALQQAEQAETMASLQAEAKNARGQRVSDYLNFLIFYASHSAWETDTDLLLHQLPVVGSGFKKIYMGDAGVTSDYVSPLHLTVHNDTKSIRLCPRITHDFDLYPNQINEATRSGRYRDVDLPEVDSDNREAPRQVIEQLRLEDLDNDGLKEPYLVTVDVETKQTLRIEPAYGLDDIKTKGGKIVRIERWNPYPDFKFLPDPKGGFYGTGLAKLLEPITDAIDANFNQLMDAGTAQIAGGGFMSAGVRIQGSAQGGTAWFSPGEYKMVGIAGGSLSDMIYERTLPQQSDVALQMLQMLLEAAKDISSVKDVMTGDGNNMAAVGTTLAMQNQALQVFSSIYKRVYRGFKEEFRLMYLCLQKFATDRERKQYQELTGGDLDEDFAGDGTDIQPVGDPGVVTKMQKVSRVTMLTQLAESEIGKAAGMTQSGPAQALVLEAMNIMEWDRPERFVADVPPNPMEVAELQAKVQDMQAKAALNQANAQKSQVDAGLIKAKTDREQASAALEMDKVHEKAEELTTRPLGQLSPEDMKLEADAKRAAADALFIHAKTDREVGLAAIDMHKAIQGPDKSDQ